MDSYFKKIHLDLKFTVYNTLACNNSDGIMEFVSESKTIKSCLEESKNNLSVYLQKLSKNSQDFKDRILTNWINSCAGYAVATYIVALGDRHLENLMVTKDGCVFHIDFGFIFGKSPPKKSYFEPAIRLNKPMIEVMGGKAGENYKHFKIMAAKAFLHMRKNKNVILNTVMMMTDALIPNLPSQ